MAANEKKSGVVNWFDTRFPITDLLERHLSKISCSNKPELLVFVWISYDCCFSNANPNWFVANDELHKYRGRSIFFG